MMTDDEKKIQTSALSEATRNVARRREVEGKQRKTPIAPLTPEQRAENRRKSQERNLLHSGLQRLKEGQPPTKTQAPIVGAYVADYEAKFKALQRKVNEAEADAEYERGLYTRIADEWNSVWYALGSVGIDLYERGGLHGWRGADKDGKEVVNEGYATLREALKAALEWRIGQG